jgi:hypothetical protein
MPGGREIEPSGMQQRAELSLTLSDRELKLARMFFDGAASDGEIAAASVSFARSLRDRQVSASEFEPLLEILEAEPVLESAPEQSVVLDHFSFK